MFLAPPPSSVAVKPSHEILAPSAANEVAVDNGVAATIIGETPSWDYILVWTSKGVVVRPHLACITQDSNIVLAGTRFAHVCNQGGKNTVLEGTFKKPKSVAVLTTKSFVTLAGHGSLIAGGDGKNLWRFDPNGKVKLKTYPADIIVFDVDGGRILVGRNNNLLELVSSSGHTISQLKISHEGGALLRGGQIVSIALGRVTVSNLKGKTVQSRKVAGGATLLDAQDGLVVYNAGTRLHLLRLSDGRDVRLRFKNQLAYADAKLSHGGLYYAFTSGGIGKPGHAGFISAAGVQAYLSK